MKERVVCKLQTEEEHLLDKFTDVLNSQRNGDSESEEINDDEIGIEDGGIDPAVLAGRMEIDREHDDDGDGNGDDDGGTNDGNADNVGNDKKMIAMLEGIGGNQNETIGVCVNVKKAAVNELVLNQDVIGYGKAELEKLNLGKVQVCERARRMQLKMMSRAVMYSVTMINNLDAGGEGSSSNNDQEHMQAAFERLRLEIATGGGHELVL